MRKYKGKTNLYSHPVGANKDFKSWLNSLILSIITIKGAKGLLDHLSSVTSGQNGLLLLMNLVSA